MESTLNKSDIKELTKDELIEWFAERGMPSYRAGQVHKWLYLRQADSFEEMTDLGKALRQLLTENFGIHRLEVAQVQTSTDGTRKFLFKLADGHHIESVLIPSEDRRTLCISSQVGCRQACRFCLTAKGGFTRDLTAGEIIAQVRDINHLVGPEDAITNIVFMGMGEPLDNYDNVLRALAVITDGDFGLKISGRKVTVSTSGLVPVLERLGSEARANLAISLNATDDKTRDMLMPVNRRHPLAELLAACKAYPLAPREKITFEYILIGGVNDSDEDAQRLIKLLRPIKSKVNLIPFNEHEGCDFKRPSDERVNRFLSILLDSGFTAIVRKSMGRDISAACGQLSANQKKIAPTIAS